MFSTLGILGDYHGITMGLPWDYWDYPVSRQKRCMFSTLFSVSSWLFVAPRCVFHFASTVLQGAMLHLHGSIVIAIGALLGFYVPGRGQGVCVFNLDIVAGNHVMDGGVGGYVGAGVAARCHI